jgi:hypothetical protein
MIGKLKYILTLILVINITWASGQNSQLMYYMNIPQNHLMNPALRPSNTVYIGLPALSGINLNTNNNFVNFSDVFIKGQPKDSIISFLHPNYNVDNFLAKIKARNFMESESTIQLLGIGFSVGRDGYVFLDINDRFDSNIVLPGDLFKLALKGNGVFAGSRIDLSALRADMKYYHEIGLGYSRNITDRLRVGVKGKLLFGVATAAINNKSLGITVNSDYSHVFDANLDINVSGPVNVYMDSKHNVDSVAFDDNRFDNSSGIRDFVTGKKNTGLGLDIGATYDLTDRIIVSAAITDLGFIRWKKDVTRLSTDNQFVFNGLDMVDFFNGTKTIDEIGKHMVDSLKNAFVITKSKAAFTTFLPFGISLAGSYNVTSKFSVGLLSYTRIISKQLREALTISANINLGNALSASIGYTAANHQYDNLGAALAFRAGVTQFYLVTDRIPVVWDRIKSDNSNIVIPANWNTFNIRLGMNLVFGNRVKEKKDKPMIVVE